MAYSTLKPGEFRLTCLFSRLHSRTNSSDQFHQDVSIHCELFAARLEDKPKYSALSYTWGDAADKVPIYVNNAEFPVTRNLRVALEHLRNDDENITLWIDALCINQDNAMEKSEQVQQMKHIYKNAINTIVWLGPAENDSDRVILEFNRVGEYMLHHGIYDLVIKMANIPGEQKENFHQLETKVKESFAGLFKDALQNLPDTLLFTSSAQELLSRPYWERIWILQEFVVSSEVQIRCGKSKISFEYFHGSIFYLPMVSLHIVQKLEHQLSGLAEQCSTPDEIESIDPLLKSQFFALAGMKFNYSAFPLFGMRLLYRLAPKANLTLTSLLSKAHISSKAKSSNEKDHIFALLGMASDTHGIKPDYDQSESCPTIYTRAASAIIASGEVDLLSFSQNQAKPPDVPTWVPDWRAEILRPCGRLPWETSFSASGNRSFKKASGLENICENEMKLCGCQIDVIETLKAPWKLGPGGCTSDKIGIGRYLMDIFELCVMSNGKFKETGADIYANTSNRGEAHIRIPIADQEQYGPGFKRRATQDCHQGHAEVVEELRRLRSRKRVEGYTAVKTSYYNMMGWQRYRKPFLSVQGYVGLAPAHVEKGDLIVIFFGGKFPYIIRRNNDGRFAFIGEAYVHGIMYGEFMETKVQSDEFVLM
jgi:hypothetical protein